MTLMRALLRARSDRNFRWALYKVLDKFESEQSMREILKRRFK